MTGGKDLKLIDTAGLNESEHKDNDHLKNMNEDLKKATPFLKQFVLVTNGSNRFDSGQTNIILETF